MITWIAHAWCGLWTRHADSMPKFEPDTVCLVCARCGFQSPGWKVERREYGRRPAEGHRYTPAHAVAVSAMQAVGPRTNGTGVSRVSGAGGRAREDADVIILRARRQWGMSQ